MGRNSPSANKLASENLNDQQQQPRTAKKHASPKAASEATALLALKQSGGATSSHNVAQYSALLQSQ